MRDKLEAGVLSAFCANAMLCHAMPRCAVSSHAVTAVLVSVALCYAPGLGFQQAVASYVYLCVQARMSDKSHLAPHPRL